MSVKLAAEVIPFCECGDCRQIPAQISSVSWRVLGDLGSGQSLLSIMHLASSDTRAGELNIGHYSICCLNKYNVKDILFTVQVQAATASLSNGWRKYLIQAHTPRADSLGPGVFRNSDFLNFRIKVVNQL